MSERRTRATAFLTLNGWADAARAPLAGDASNRRYERLRHPDLGAAVLMDAPPERGEDVRPFIAVAEHLAALGLSPPRVFARDEEHGFLLLEDLGDALFKRVIHDAPDLEQPLYTAATDVLLELHRAALPEGLPTYDAELMSEMAGLAFDWYLAHAGAPDPNAKSRFQVVFEPLLARLSDVTPVLIQRDYHAENLLWLPERTGAARVGLLDFQDAMAGHPAYDLVSLLQDARRDVPPAIEAAMIAHYINESGRDRAAFENAYHLLGAQRNLRILGVFARLCLRDGKSQYLDLIPRVWGLLQRDLDHPALAPVADMLRAALPAPDATLIDRLKEKCGQTPTP